MNEIEGTKRREWVKNAAIIFLTVMLLLTFFSNTIMNYSLPEVATSYVQRGTITAKVRGTGNVEATDPYKVIAKESRVIASVAVKQGDQVEKDQVLYYLEDAESDELKKAEDELEDLELAYMKGLFGGTVSPEIINKVASGNTDSFASYQAMVTDMQNRLKAAENRVQECQKAVDAITLQSTIHTNETGVSTISEEKNKDQATTDLAKAEKEFERQKNEKVGALNSQITEVKKQISDLQILIENGSIEIGTGTASGTTTDLQGKKAAALVTLNEKLAALNHEMGTSFVTAADAYAWSKNVDWNKLGDNEVQTNNRQIALQNFLAAYTDYSDYSDSLSDVSQITSNEEKLAQKENELTVLQSKLAEINAITVSSSQSVQDAQNKLNQANQNIAEITNTNKQTAAAYQNQLANANAALKNAQAVYELVKAEQTKLAADINAELDLAKTNQDIAEKKEEIAKLKEKSMGAAITAPVAGTVTSLAYVAGETTKPEEAAAVIQVEGKGFTLSISVTNEQAKKVQVGDTAELQNAWYYEDVKVILKNMKPDPDNPGQKKLLVFEVSGSSIQEGQALNISVGQKSAEYELIVPNSAVREDNNGKFILIVESKSSPLGNRYKATRVDVEVLASDDNNTAISAPLYGYEYVITTSTKPVEAGKQVRLSEV